jgi:hypothetical protein
MPNLSQSKFELIAPMTLLNREMSNREMKRAEPPHSSPFPTSKGTSELALFSRREKDGDVVCFP